MKSTIAVCLGAALIMLLPLNSTEAQQRGRGGQRNQAAAGNQLANPGAAQMQNRARNGMAGGFGITAQLVQTMITQFDQDGDQALNAAELQVAMNAFMQHLQAQMQQRHGMQQGMGMGQGLAGEQGQMMGYGGPGQHGGGPSHGQAGGGGGAGRGR